MKIKLKVRTFPDGSSVAETMFPFKKISECTKLLSDNGFVRDADCGNLIRFSGTYSTAFIVIGEQTHPYSHPEKHLYSISVYPKAEKLCIAHKQ